MARINSEGLFALAKRRADELGYGRIVTVLIVILFAVGAAGHLYRPTLPLMLGMTPWFLLGCGIAVILPSLGSGGLRFGLWAFVVYALTFFLEALGGSYRPGVRRVPLRPHPWPGGLRSAARHSV